MISITQKQLDKFWGKIDKEKSKTFYNGSRCWEWTASHDPKGYGTFQFLGKVRKVNRVSWMIAFGDIPDGLWVLHHCDNPACVRPDHLFLGTRQDNIDDMMKKGRGVFPGAPRGEKNGNYKIPDDVIFEIRKTYKPYSKGNNLYDLARKHGLAPSTVYQIVTYKRRK